jgi:dihydroorotate dehydrogenase
VIYPISKTSSIAYKYIGRPILFSIKPDTVHDGLLKTTTLVQRSELLMAATSAVFAYNNPKYLKQTLHGVEYANPVGLSAGFDQNFQTCRTMKAVGFGFIEGGSISAFPCEGNPKPWFHRLPKSKGLLVNKGLANDGVEEIAKRLKSYNPKLHKDFVINISVAKTNSPDTCDDAGAIADYIKCLEQIQAEGIGDVITINISCPNAFGGEPFNQPKRLRSLLKAIFELDIKQPIYLKMPSDLDWTDFSGLIDVATEFDVKGLTISNLLKTRDSEEVLDEISDDLKGNISGKPLVSTSNKLIKLTREGYGDRFTISGVGGVFSAQDAYEKIKYGASLIELITGMIYGGPQAIGQINRGLVKLLKRDGFNNISEAVGAEV